MQAYEAHRPSFDPSDRVRLTPGRELLIPLDLKAEFPLRFSVRIPVTHGPGVRLELLDGETTLAAWDSTADPTATWQAAGPFPLCPGRHSLALRPAPVHGDQWPESAEPFELADASL